MRNFVLAVSAALTFWAITLAVTPAKADGLDSIFQGINELVHAHHHRYESEAPPEEEGPHFDPRIPGHILSWLEKHGEVTPLIVGRRDLDCEQANTPAFVGGWGVLLKHTNPDKSVRAVSGVVCLSYHQEPSLRLDRE